jgi:hypothetical protein
MNYKACFAILHSHFQGSDPWSYDCAGIAIFGVCGIHTRVWWSTSLTSISRSSKIFASFVEQCPHTKGIRIQSLRLNVNEHPSGTPFEIGQLRWLARMWPIGGMLQQRCDTWTYATCERMLYHHPCQHPIKAVRIAIYPHQSLRTMIFLVVICLNAHTIYTSSRQKAGCHFTDLHVIIQFMYRCFQHIFHSFTASIK